MDVETRSHIVAGRYAVERRVGEGGGGSVFLAFDQALQRWVAIKTLKHGDGVIAMNEATQLASLQHQNVVSVYDIFSENEEIFVVMEFVAGWTLEDLPEPMGEAEFRDFAAQCLAGIGAAHARGIVHRDIKPSNIMLAETEQGRRVVKILDFGLAKRLPEPQEQSMDQNGALTGSIYTMSPEQLSGGLVDHRTDFYSLGCVFYQALTLSLPFQGANIPEVVAAHLQHRHVPLAELRPDLPAALLAWVEGMFSLEVDGRPLEASEAAAGLAGSAPVVRRRQAVKPPPPLWKNPVAVGAALVAALMAAVAFFLLKPPAESEAPPAPQAVVEGVEGTGDVVTRPAVVPEPFVVEGRVLNFSPKSKGVKVLAVQRGDGSRIEAVVFSEDVPGEFDDSFFENLEGKTVRISGTRGEFNGQEQVEFAARREVEVLSGPADGGAEAGVAEAGGGREEESAAAGEGEFKTVEGTVKEFVRKGAVVRVLSMTMDGGERMEAVFFADKDPPEFSDGELEALVGRRISVTGRPQVHKGRDQVVFERKDDLGVME
ncbi:MAG: protein kinase domain-containing protein [Terrimicrobiaceae bacterium]